MKKPIALSGAGCGSSASPVLKRVRSEQSDRPTQTLAKRFEEIGVQKGMQAKEIDIVKNMLAKGIDIKTTAEITKLSIEKVRQIKDETN